MLNKVDGLRRQFKKIQDKRQQYKREEDLDFDEKAAQGKLRGIDKKAHELKTQLEKEEAKLKTSLKSTKQ